MRTPPDSDLPLSNTAMSPVAASDGTTAHGAAGQPWHLVFNSGSGSASEERVAHIKEALAAAGRRAQWHDAADGRTLQAALTAAQAARSEGGIVVAVGGDGTVSAVAHQAVREGVPMAVIPAGTFNLFARAHGIALDAQAAVAAALTLPERRVAVGQLGEQVFVVSVSLGLHPDLIAAREEDTQRFGRDRRIAWLSGFARLWQMRSTVSLRMEGQGMREQVRASTLLVSNNPVQLSAMGAAVDGQPGDSLDALQVFVVPPRQGLQWLPVIWQALWGRLREAAGVQAYSLRELTLNPLRQRALRLAVDGELQRRPGPVSLRLLPDALRLVGSAAGGTSG